MSLLIIVLIGFAIGLLAKLLLPGRGPGGFLLTSLLGIAGAVTSEYRVLTY